MWGQVVELSKTEVTKRIIPTRVGTRRLAEVEMLIKRDHPHACGDKGSAGLSGALCLGSSPRVWGQVCECVKHSDNIRIIPTRVGTSGGSVLSDSITQDHPHACGDKRATPSMCERSKGSSPRVWGQVH